MKRFVYILLLCVVVFSSCGETPYFEENKEISDHSWGWDEPVSFAIDVTDTVNAFNYYFNLRTTKSYEFSNIYIFFNTKFPDGRISRDTIECPLSDDAGNWLGKTSGSLIENKILFRVKRIFPIGGTYTFTIEQGMRVPELAEITDVGLRLEKSTR